MQPRRLLGHEPREFQFDLRGRQWMSDSLVRADRNVPHLTFTRVRDGAVERVPADAIRERSAEDPLRIQAEEDLAEPLALVADEPVGRDLDVVEEQLELLLGRSDLDRDGLAIEAGCVGVDDEE